MRSLDDVMNELSFADAEVLTREIDKRDSMYKAVTESFRTEAEARKKAEDNVRVLEQRLANVIRERDAMGRNMGLLNIKLGAIALLLRADSGNDYE